MAVTTQMENGFMTIRVHCTTLLHVVQSKRVKTVSAMADQIWGIFFGDGSRTSVISPGLTPILSSI